MSEKKNLGHNSKKDFLNKEVEHIDITSFDARKIISSMKKMSFVSRETANAAGIFNEMIFLASKEVISICSTSLFKKFFLLLCTRFFFSDI